MLTPTRRKVRVAPCFVCMRMRAQALSHLIGTEERIGEAGYKATVTLGRSQTQAFFSDRMAPEGITLQQVENPSDARIAEAAALFADLMHNDASMISLTGGASELVGPLGRAMLRAGAQYGQYYEAADAHGRLVGFLMTMPPGQDLFSTDEQRALGLTEFMIKLPEAGKEYYRTTYMSEFPAFVNRNLGPTGKRDSWYIHMLMVKREYQGRGIGKGLIGLVRKKAAKNGDLIAMSCTTDTNAVIYQRCGLTLRDRQIMPSPWGEWPLYLLALDTTT